MLLLLRITQLLGYQVLTIINFYVKIKEVQTNQVLATWDSIAKAAEFEQFCDAKMSRAIKNKTIFGDYYYYYYYYSTRIYYI